jgi:S-methylmethionine-dependent homocysteine/selenocysteine methylase
MEEIMDMSAATRRYLGASAPWLADGGLETDIIFHHGIDLPAFASFVLLDTPEGRDALTLYFDRYLALARGAGTGFVLDTATWRANAPWMRRMGLTDDDVARVNADAVRFAKGVARRWGDVPHVLNGVIGPAGDGYAVGQGMTPQAARDAHMPQVAALATAGVDLVTAMTMTHVEEADGIVAAAETAGLPVAVSFTVETDGNLPSGQPLAQAIAALDDQTRVPPLYYMVNCAHPDHFAHVLDGADWAARIGGVRANASRQSHAELDAATELDEGDADEFGQLYARLARDLPGLRVIGGCCGTDHRHVGAAAAWLTVA